MSSIFVRAWTLLGIVSTLSGCAGTLYTSTKVSPDIGTDIPGVLYYPPILVKETFQTTVALDKDGKVVGALNSASTPCTPVRTEKLATIPDYAHPKRLYYVPATFESSTFGVTLDSTGLLTGVNIQSNPDQGKTISAVGTGLGALAQLFAATVRPGAIPACTDGSSLISIEPAPPVR
jgi:hypothetical protein